MENKDEEICPICNGEGEVMAAPDRVEGGEVRDAVFRKCDCQIKDEDESDE